LDRNIEDLKDLPYTISYVIRKRQQIDNLSELPKEKRPSEWHIWWAYPEEMEKWLDRIISGKSTKKAELIISEDEIE
jgi:hypothetical protein